MGGITFVGTGVTLEGRQGESLTATLLRAGYAMRIGCHRGGCGICRVQITSGQITYATAVAETVLPEAERQQGVALACRAMPVGDVTVFVPEEDRLRCIAPMLVPYAARRTPATSPGSVTPSHVDAATVGPRPDRRHLRQASP